MDAAATATPETFMERVFGDLSATCMTAMAALGDRLGLFKALHEGGPATSEELAARTGLNERYLREWLSAVACGGYLGYDPGNARFALPAAHAPILAQEEGPMFLGGLHQIIPLTFGVLDRVEASFRKGGGVSQSDYDERLWDHMERETAPVFDHALVQCWIPAMSGAHDRLSAGARVADIGCGSGRAIINLARAYPRSSFVGYDLHPPQIERARTNAARSGVSDRVRFEAADASGSLADPFDLITSFDCLHDAPDPDRLLATIRSGLAPGGACLIQEYNCSDKLEENIGPVGAFLYSASVLYCMTTSLAHGGAGLGTAGLPESRLREMAGRAGFAAVRRLPIEDPFNALYELTA